MTLANNSLERTQPQRGFMYDVAMLRRSARSRWAARRTRTRVSMDSGRADQEEKRSVPISQTPYLPQSHTVNRSCPSLSGGHKSHKESAK